MSPLVWLLLGARRGDNDQVETLARMLGVEAVAKQLTFDALHLLPGWVLGESLAGLTSEARKLIAPPWPELVIAAGRRSAPVARYIKKVSEGHTKLVHIGRPRAPLSDFDLVITTPQYGLPRDPNVIELSLPFALPKPVAASDLAYWRDRWAALPRPLTGVAVGAGKFPQKLGPREAECLAAALSPSPGSLIVMASPRTDGRVIEVLKQRVPAAQVHAWGEGANPYQAALALADRFVVTSDSLSMLSEVMETGKPVSVFRLPVSPLFLTWNARSGIMASLARAGLLSPPRNMPELIDRLIAGEERNEILVRLDHQYGHPPPRGTRGGGGPPEAVEGEAPQIPKAAESAEPAPPPRFTRSPCPRLRLEEDEIASREDALARVGALLA